VKDKYRVRVPEMTRREMHATLLHYANTGNFYYLDGALPLVAAAA